MKDICVRLNDQDNAKLLSLKKTLKNEYCIDYNTSQIIRFCLSRTYYQISEQSENNKTTG